MPLSSRALVFGNRRRGDRARGAHIGSTNASSSSSSRTSSSRTSVREKPKRPVPSVVVVVAYEPRARARVTTRRRHASHTTTHEDILDVIIIASVNQSISPPWMETSMTHDNPSLDDGPMDRWMFVSFRFVSFRFFRFIDGHLISIGDSMTDRPRWSGSMVPYIVIRGIEASIDRRFVSNDEMRRDETRAQMMISARERVWRGVCPPSGRTGRTEDGGPSVRVDRACRPRARATKRTSDVKVGTLGDSGRRRRGRG